MTKIVHHATVHYDIDTPLQTECVVSGVLSFILRLSRIAGTAPLKFKRIRGGWCVCASRSYCLYGYIVMISLTSELVIYYFVKGDEISEDQAPRDAFTDLQRFLEGVWVIFLITVSVITYHTSYSRMCCMIHCISQLTLINEKMNYYYGSLPENNAILWIFVITSLFCGYLNIIIDYGIYIYDLILAGRVDVLSCALIMEYLLSLVMHLYVIQFALIIMKVVSTFQRMNKSLKVLLYEISRDSSSSESASMIARHIVKDNNQISVFIPIPHYVACVIDLVPVIGREESTHIQKIRHLTIIYCSICDVIRQLNNSEGITLLMTLLFNATYMVTIPYFMFTSLYTNGPATSEFALLMVYFVFTLIMFATIVEPCQRTQEQLELTSNLIHNMLRYIRPEDKTVRFELKLFKRHILLNPVSFSPFQLLTLNRGTLVTTLFTVVTNLTVLMNL